MHPTSNKAKRYLDIAFKSSISRVAFYCWKNLGDYCGVFTIDFKYVSYVSPCLRKQRMHVEI